MFKWYHLEVSIITMKLEVIPLQNDNTLRLSDVTLKVKVISLWI